MEDPGLIGRALARGRHELLRFAGRDSITGLTVRGMPGLRKLGSDYGGWIVPVDRLGPGAVCYCAGAGEDISFDLALARDLGCDVITIDPTPRAVQFVRRAAEGVPGLRFVDCGLWDRDETLRFFAPGNPDHVSHSVLNLHGTTEFFEARCRPLADLMREFGHDRVDVLKLDIEGAEYRVLDSVLAAGIDVGVICVEFDEAHHPLDAAAPERIGAAMARLQDAGYVLVAVDTPGNYTLVHEPLAVPAGA